MNEIILSKEPIWFELNCQFTNLIVWKYTKEDSFVSPVNEEGIYLRIIKGAQGSIMLSITTKPYIGVMEDCVSTTIDSIIALGDNPLPLNKESELIELLKKFEIVTM